MTNEPINAAATAQGQESSSSSKDSSVSADAASSSSCSTPIPANGNMVNGQCHIEDDTSISSKDRMNNNNNTKKSGDKMLNGREFYYFPWFPSLNFLYNNPLGRLLIGESMKKEKHSDDGLVRSESAKNPPSSSLSRKLFSSTKSSSSTPNSNSTSNSEIRVALSTLQVQSNEPWRQYVEQIPEAKFYRSLLLHGYLTSNKILTRLPTLKSQRDDVVICSYPKSGTTWTEEMVYLMLKARSLDNNLENDPALKVPLFERVVHMEVGEPRFHWHRLKKNRRPRIMATHLPFSFLPDDFQKLDTDSGKIIYVIRNPKDVAVSYFYHHQICKLFGHYKGTWDQFIECFMDGHCVYGSWFTHVQGFWRAAQQSPDQILVIAYEELIVDFRKMARIIGNFLGKDLTDDQVNAIEEHCSFNKMKDNKAVNREVTIIKDIFDMSHGVKFCRKGMIGDWMNHFSAAQALRMDQMYARWVRDLQTNGQLQGFRCAFTEQEARRMMADDGRIIRLNS